MRYYIIAGEASGDLHASNLIKSLKAKDSNADFRCWGGDLMEKEGAKLVKHYRDLAFMGFVEVLMNIKTILKNINFCKEDILSYKPDALILVDYPGFNLRIAEFAKSKGIKVFYYISPQVWAWNQSRVHKIKKIVDKMLVILPFEKDFYAKFDYNVDFVGHPLLDAIENYVPAADLVFNKPVIAIIPGSRKQEIAKMLPVMLSIQPFFPDYQLVITGAPSIPSLFYKNYMKEGTEIVYNRTYDILKIAKAALVTSGTATLETALFEVPEVVCYNANYLSYSIAKKLIKVKFISLVNLIMDKEIVKELIQENFNSYSLRNELNSLLEDKDKLKRLRNDYKELKQKLGGIGASEKTAETIIFYLNNGK